MTPEEALKYEKEGDYKNNDKNIEAMRALAFELRYFHECCDKMLKSITEQKEIYDGRYHNSNEYYT